MFRRLAPLCLLFLAAPAAAQLDHPDRDAILERMNEQEKHFGMTNAELRQGAAAGDMRALQALEIRYQSGLSGLKQSFAEAERLRNRKIQIAKQRAAEGDGYAMYQVTLHQSAYESMGFDDAFRGYMAAANAGDPEAMKFVGLAYEFGRGAPKNEAEAERWFERSASAGSCDAMTRRAFGLSENSKGAPDVAAGLRWYRIAAENPYACGNGANYALALIYSEGRGNVPRNYPEALKYFLKTAERGNPVGAMQIGFYYEKGLGTAVNKAEALKWFKIAGFNSVAAARAELRRLQVPEPE